MYKTTDSLHQNHKIYQTTDICTNVKQQLSTKYKDSALSINCQESFLEMEVQPETCGRFSVSFNYLYNYGNNMLN